LSRRRLGRVRHGLRFGNVFVDGRSQAFGCDAGAAADFGAPSERTRDNDGPARVVVARGFAVAPIALVA
jgi:hypothetical protein